MQVSPFVFIIDDISTSKGTHSGEEEIKAITSRVAGPGAARCTPTTTQPGAAPRTSTKIRPGAAPCTPAPYSPARYCVRYCEPCCKRYCEHYYQCYCQHY